jgi:transcription-repair coupling factor (superfamily II helicase)
LAKSKNLTEIVIQGKFLKIAPITLAESAQLRITRMYPGTLIKPATQSILIARLQSPNWLENGPVGDTSVLSWVKEVLNSV